MMTRSACSRASPFAAPTVCRTLLLAALFGTAMACSQARRRRRGRQRRQQRQRRQRRSRRRPRRDRRQRAAAAAATGGSGAAPAAAGGSGGSGGSGGAGGSGGSGGSATRRRRHRRRADRSGRRDGGPAVSLFIEPLAPLPTKLSETGLFTALPDITKVHPRAFLFEPRYPLWSNGLGKIRHAVIPEGKKINSTGAARQNWDFPIGTLFFKTFTQDPGAGGKVRPVETRLIRRIKDAGPLKEQWEMVVYQWNAEETDATLLDNPNIAEPGQVTDRRQDHRRTTSPRAPNCQQCHVANFTQIIGFDELRLNGKLTPAAAKTQLQEVIDKGWLTTTPDRAPGGHHRHECRAPVGA